MMQKLNDSGEVLWLSHYKLEYTQFAIRLSREAWVPGYLPAGWPDMSQNAAASVWLQQLA